MNKKIIRAADYIPKKNRDGDLESLELPESEAIEKGYLKLSETNDADEDGDEGLLDTEVEHYG